MTRALLAAAFGLLVSFLPETSPAAESLVTRTLPLPGGWRQGDYVTAAGTIGASDDVPPGAPAGARSAEIAVDYSGEGFQFFSVQAAEGDVPGRCKRLRVWVKTLHSDHSFQLVFRDATGRETIDGRKLEWPLQSPPGQWKELEFAVPETWTQPVRVDAVSAHNWNRQKEKARAAIRAYGLEVTTDVAGLDRAGLVRVRAATGAEWNVFVEGEPVRYAVAGASWLGERLQGKLAWRVTDAAGQEVAQDSRQVAFTGNLDEAIGLKPPRYGAYRISLQLDLNVGKRFEQTSRFAWLPKPLDLTEAEKKRSPWGLNIHGGKPGVGYDAIARTGFTWVRDYAYSKPWLDRARGDDGRYAGWPWYPRMDRRLRASGLMLLPCMIGAIGEEVKAGRTSPSPQWKRDLVHILWAFPQYPAWELDNEYDYNHLREESARDWAAYEAYHKLFGQAVKFMDRGVLAVEQGTAGVHPDWVRRAISRGAFAEIDVVNAHFYCGVDPPEVSTENVNAGGEGQVPVLLWDHLREFVQAADSDGRDRQAWITEMGWDTLSGHVVSEAEQAAYLQRGYCLGLQAGLDKMFWYWDRDTKETPKQFFDGCGLFDPRDEPKPAVAAMAALARLLKQPEPAGTFALGPGTMGHVFRDRGRLVACAFTVEKGSPPVTATLPPGEVFDAFGNKLQGRTHPLGAAPVWIVGVPEDDPAVLQTAYGLGSRGLVRASAGDALEVKLAVRNRRRTPLAAEVVVEGPSNWACPGGARQIAVEAGKTGSLVFPVTLDAKERAGTRKVDLVVREGAVQKRLSTTVLVLPAAEITAGPLPRTPGTARWTARVKNLSQQARSFVISVEAPEGWRIEPRRASLSDVPAGGVREAAFKVTWQPAWKAGESARAVVANEAGEALDSCGIVPGAIRVPAVKDIRCDGDLGDWPAAARLPDWTLGPTGDDPGAAVYLGYSQAGLHLAVAVARSKAEVTDPRSFWSQDCLEMFLDSRGDAAERKTYRPTDHQFWFCPLVGEKRVYAGRWKRSEEIAATQFDLPGVPSACRKQGDGYVMEMLLPAAQINGFSGRPGTKLGLNLNLSVPGRHGRSEVYWPQGKPADPMSRPHAWGQAELE